MSNRDKDKWYVLYARSAAQKKEWMEALQKEREKVKKDEEKGTSIVWMHVLAFIPSLIFFLFPKLVVH